MEQGKNSQNNQAHEEDSSEDRGEISLRKDFVKIISVNQPIIKYLKAQKVRADKMLDKYGEIIDDELEIPTNRFMHWTRAVNPYKDAVVSSKLSDFELIQAYEKYVRDLINYEKEYVIDEVSRSNLEYVFDVLVDSVNTLEIKYDNLKRQYTEDVFMTKLNAIKTHTKYNDIDTKVFGRCIYCGIKLNDHKGDSSDECRICKSIPLEHKDEVRKTELKLKKGVKGQKVFDTTIQKKEEDEKEPETPSKETRVEVQDDSVEQHAKILESGKKTKEEFEKFLKKL